MPKVKSIVRVKASKGCKGCCFDSDFGCQDPNYAISEQDDFFDCFSHNCIYQLKEVEVND